MWKIALACALLLGTASTSHQKRYINNDRGYAPDYGFIDPYEFHQKLTQQIMAQQNQQNRAFSSVFASNDASAFAEASNVADYDEFFQEQFAHQQRLFDNLRRQSQAGAYNGASSSSYGYGSGSGSGSAPGTSYNSGPNIDTRFGSNSGYGTRSGSSNNYGTNYASASGSFGPGGGHQTASIFPENPNVPNINTRFDDSDSGNTGGGGGGFRGVSVSSYSSSSDVNGKRTNQRGASTTINDNGKVSTYHVHS